MINKTTEERLEDKYIMTFGDEGILVYTREEFGYPTAKPIGIFDFIRQELQRQKQELVEKLQWELSDILIKERSVGGHMDIAKYIKRLDKFKTSLLKSEEEETEEKA